jgi:hypothetical protein
MKLQRICWAGSVAHMEEVGNAYILVAKSESKRPLAKSRPGWEHNKIDIKETGRGLDSAAKWQAFVNMVIKCWVP